MKDFVIFDLARKLKEKGFPQKCFGKYEMLDACYIDDGRFYIDGCIVKVEKAYTAPTISQVLKWLREEKEVYIVIEPFPTMATKNKICWGWSFKWHSDGIYIDHTFADDASYATYEEAELAGINYVLDNLI